MFKINLKSFLVSFAMAFMPIACFCGAITSSIAWYAYESNVVLDYNGTAVSVSNFLQVGIKSDLPALEEQGLHIENGIAWADPGDGLTPEQINIYLQANGYAYLALTPLTSGPYNEFDPLLLTAAPTYGVVYNPTPGEKTSYAYLPLAFRVKDSNGVPLKNVSVWLAESEILCKEYEDLKNGVRLHFKSDVNTFILNPSAITAGATALAGLQDLNFDEYYDYDFSTGKEYMYGQYEGEAQYNYITEDTDFDDINHTGHTSASTFYSKHRQNKYVVQSYDNLQFKYANYESIASITPTKKPDGSYVGGKPICITSNDDDAIGYSDMTLWIEGWDHSVYDKAAGYRFLMNLTFNI